MQLSLFSAEPPSTDDAVTSGLLDAESEQLLSQFQAMRLAQGAHPRSVQREVSQLRAVAREAGSAGQPVSLVALLADLKLVAHVLREPGQTIARSTGQARLLAVQRFIQVMSRALGRNAARDLATLDRQLPARRSSGWHESGTVVAGTAGRRRRHGPTLGASDLRRIVDAVDDPAKGDQAMRNRALVALHCFTGLRAEEIVALRWEQLSTELTTTGFCGLLATIQRGHRTVRLALPGPAAETITTLADAMGGTPETLSGLIFRARGKLGRGLGYRAARLILQDACRRAGLPAVESVSLRSACAHWLRSQGLSDHEVANVMGLDRVRSVDRLLRQHAALDAQRTVRELLDR